VARHGFVKGGKGTADRRGEGDQPMAWTLTRENEVASQVPEEVRRTCRVHPVKKKEESRKKNIYERGAGVARKNHDALENERSFVGGGA